ncbi:MAG: metal ABC transporter substrate-binding protein [Candidatus Ozemobacteraceae bacterium]
MKTKHSNFLLILLMTILMAAFGSTGAWAAIDVVTTTTDLQDIVKTVGGDRVRVVSIGRGHEDPHFIEPRPTFMLELSRAKLVFCIGLELEIWLKPLLEGSRNQAVQVGGPGYVDCSQAVEVKEIPNTRIDPSMGDVHALGNPHYWLDPENAVHIAELAARRLIEVDPSGKSNFIANAEAFKKDIETRIPQWKAKFIPLLNKKIACFHSSWTYFTDAFGLKIVGYVEPRPGVPPTGREMAALVGRMKSENSHIILREQYHADTFANRIAEKADAQVLVLPTSVGATPETNSYTKLIDVIVNRISQAISSATAPAFPSDSVPASDSSPLSTSEHGGLSTK